MIIGVKIFCTFVLLMTLVFSILPGGFGLNNFKKVASKFSYIAASAFYNLVWMVHLLAIYNIWSVTVNIWWSIAVPIILMVIYFRTVGKDVGAN